MTVMVTVRGCSTSLKTKCCNKMLEPDLAVRETQCFTLIFAIKHDCLIITASTTSPE